jgi:hypothetical protein
MAANSHFHHQPEIGANLRVCADEEDRANFDQRS